MKNAKRLFAMLLCIVMCISILPVAALADEGTIEASQEGAIAAVAEEETVEYGEIMPSEEDVSKETVTGIVSGETDFSADDCPVLVVNEPVTTEVNSEDKMAWFQFTPTESKLYILQPEDSEGDIYYGYLYDADMNLLSSGEYGEMEYWFQIVYSLEANNTYYFRVGYYNTDSTRRITVRLIEGPDIMSVTVSNVKEFEGNGWMSKTSVFDEELQKYVDKEFFQYNNYKPATMIVVTADRTFTGTPSGVSWEFDEYYNLLSYYQCQEQDYYHQLSLGDNPWTISFCGMTAHYTITVSENPMRSITAEDVTLLLEDKDDSFIDYIWDEEIQDYVKTMYLYYMDLGGPFSLTVVTDDKIFTGTPGDVEDAFTAYYGIKPACYISRENEEFYLKMGSNQRIFAFCGMQAPYTVQIVEELVQSVRVSDVVVSEIDGVIRKDWTWDDIEEQDIEVSYSCYNNIEPATVTVETAEKTFSGSPDEVKEAFLAYYHYNGYKKFGPRRQSYYSQLELGDNLWTYDFCDKSATYNIRVEEIPGKIASGTCGECLTWILCEDGVLTISGMGAMDDYYSGSIPWYSNKDEILSVVIENGVTSIGEYAFSNCPNLKSVTIPNSIITIEYDAFNECNNLTDIYYGSTEAKKQHYTQNNNWSSWNTALFDATWHYTAPVDGWDYCGDDVLWKYDSSTRSLTFKGTGDMWNYDRFGESGYINPPWYEKAGRIMSVNIGSGITSIGARALIGCTKITGITIPNSVTTIGFSAFNGCNNLKTVQIPSSVTSIGNSAFLRCSSLEEVILPSRITSIGDSLFDECSSLTSIIIPESVTKIGPLAFCMCRSLASVIIPDGVTSIGYEAFGYCSALQAITLPTKLKTIQNMTFTDCTSLENIVVPASVNSIETSAFFGCKKLARIIFQGDVPNISDKAFQYVTADAYYPKNADWWEDDLLDYGGKLTWHPYSTTYQEFKLNKSSMNLACGKSETLKVSGNATVLWSSKNSSIATVNGSGKVTGKKAGQTVITASSMDGSYSVRCTVKVLFTDVTDSSRSFYQPVYWALEKGITTGTSASTFSPNNSCTRAQIVTFLWRLKGCPEPSSMESPFKDVTDPTASYYKPVLWALENGITTGTSATTFSPTKACTRAQCVTFLWRALGSPEPSTQNSPFKDVTDPRASFYKAVLWALENGITTGTSKTTFSPNSTCTRGQIVTFLYRYNNLG